MRRETFENIKMISEFHRRAVVKNVHKRRTIGAMSPFDIDSSARRNHLVESAFKGAIFLWPLGDITYFLPPYCIMKEELDKVYAIINKFL
jgi:adenosylmethionine-8-amino-7-oxononanoate aminotransferase